MNKSKKFLVKKIIHEEIVNEDKLDEIIDQYKKDIESNTETTYAKKDGIPLISFQPNPPYKLEVQEVV